jgi:hypothetical protein
MSTIDIDFCPRDAVDVEISPKRAVSAAEPVRRADGLGVRVGELVALQDGFAPFVVFPGQPGTAAIRARAAVALSTRDVGREVAISFVDGDLEQPIVTGCLNDDRARALDGAGSSVEVEADGRTFVITASDEIVLRCGKASITLTRAGKILIRGTYVVSKSSGVNRIKGGTVEIN